MTAVKSRSQLGRMSRNKGAKAERDLVAYLRLVGFGGAERAVRTGYRVAGRVAADPGDVTGTPGIVWSVKDATVERLTDWLNELDTMDAGGPYVPTRLLVHKRRGHAAPARWFCWLWLDDLMFLIAEERPIRVGTEHVSVPVRMELGHVIPLLHAAGYGDPTEETA